MSPTDQSKSVLGTQLAPNELCKRSEYRKIHMSERNTREVESLVPSYCFYF